MAQCHWLEIAAKKKGIYCLHWYMIPSIYCSSISQHFAWPGGKFSMLNGRCPHWWCISWGPTSYCQAQLVHSSYVFPQVGGFPVLRELGIVRIGTNHPCFFGNSHPEGVEGLVTYRDFSLDGKAQPCMCYVWLTEHWFGEVSCSRVIILWWMLSVQLTWFLAENPMLKTQHRWAFSFWSLPPKFNIAPKKLPSLKESRLPTIILGASC